MRNSIFVFSASLLGVTLALASVPGPAGKWLDEDKNGHVEIYSCGEPRPVSDTELLTWMCNKAPAASRLCGRVVAVTDAGKKELKKLGKTPADVANMPVLCIGPPTNAENRWTGGVYSVYLDKRADAYVTPLDAARLHVKGCKVIETRWTCAEDVWTRVP